MQISSGLETANPHDRRDGRRARVILRAALCLAGLAGLAVACGTQDDAPVGTAVQALGTSDTDHPTPTQEAPRVLDRSIHLIDDESATTPRKHTKPIIPPFRTSADGRIGIDIDRGNFYLLSPEKLQASVMTGAPGPQIVASKVDKPSDMTVYYNPLTYSHDYDTIPTTDHPTAIAHQVICDPAPQANPHRCTSADGDGSHTSDQDCYTLTMISFVEFMRYGVTRVHPVSRQFTAVVTSPKTSGATLAIDFNKPGVVPIPGPKAFYSEFFKSPSITSDGRLLVGKLQKSLQDPNVGSAPPRTVALDVVYSVYPLNDTGEPCDVRKWDYLQPMANAYTDPNMRDAAGKKYGVAEYPFRDPHGFEIAAGQDLQGSYPWIDRAGKNLFFTTVQATNFYRQAPFNQGDPPVIRQRYEATCPSNAPNNCATPTDMNGLRDVEPPQNFGGTAVAGSWTHGKMVLLDSIINNSDYGFGARNLNQRDVKLYASGDPLRLGAGRYPAGLENFPIVSSVTNMSFIDSLEHMFFWNDDLKPYSVRDVVWLLNTGKVTAELIFDDYLDPNAIIFSEMSGALRHQGTAGEELAYYDGFNQVAGSTVNRTVGRDGTTGTVNEVRFQNAATSPSWTVPAYGLAHGDVRLEPVALGGIEGKGAFLDGAEDAISFDIADQSTAPTVRSMNSSQRYLSVFVEPRFGDDGVKRRLFTFSNGARIVLDGHTAIELRGPNNTLLNSFNIASTSQRLTQSEWTHVAFVFDYEHGILKLLLNGYLQGSVSEPNLPPLSGTLHVGTVDPGPAKGFKGWIDEVKLLGYEPSFELACNHARGTLMKTTANGAACGGAPCDCDGVPCNRWRLRSESYPQTTHDAISALRGVSSGPKYICYHDWSSPTRGNPRAVSSGFDLVSIREKLTAGGPLQYNVVRPDSTGNTFCLSCHHDNGKGGLNITPALSAGTVPMASDPRRQPMNPPPTMLGNIPVNVFGTAMTGPISIDQFSFP